MYRIFANGEVLHDPRLDSLDRTVSKPSASLGLNKAGSVSFTIHPGHPLYSSLNPMTTIVDVYDDDERIFRGRVLDERSGFYNDKGITCEGELAYLNDSLFYKFIENYSVSGSTLAPISVQLEKALDYHNSEPYGVGDATIGNPHKRILLGNVSQKFTDLVCIPEQPSDFQSVLSIIQKEFLDKYGGYLILRYEGDQKYLDYVDELTSKSGQKIEFGVNLLDITRYIDSSNVFTRIVPYGSNRDINLSNSSYYGKIYIEHPTFVSIFGVITRSHQWSFVESNSARDLAALATLGSAYLEDALANNISIDISAIDLTLAGVQTDKIRVGDSVRVVSKPHGLDKDFLCSAIEYDFENPGNSKYSFGFTGSSLTSEISKF